MATAGSLPAGAGGRFLGYQTGPHLSGFTEAEIYAIAEAAAEASRMRCQHVPYGKAQIRQDRAWTEAVAARRRRAGG